MNNTTTARTLENLSRLAGQIRATRAQLLHATGILAIVSGRILADDESAYHAALLTYRATNAKRPLPLDCRC